jgi:SAM-dependent methyltransferase
MTRASDLEQHLADQAGAGERFESFFWHRLRSAFALAVIARLAPLRPVIVDVGAGAGIFGRHFQRRFPDGTYGFIEPIPELAQRLRQRFSPAADWSQHPRWDADGLVLLDVLEHQPDDVAFLAELRAKMKPGAFLVITCPALSWLWSDWDEKLGHYRRYTPATLRAAATRAGFDVLEARYLFPALVLPGIFRRLRGRGSAEFPRFSTGVNSILYQLGRAGLVAGRWIPFGSSVALVCQSR